MKWVEIRPDAMPPKCEWILLGASLNGLWRPVISMVVPDATYSTFAQEGVFTHWAELPAWIMKKPPPNWTKGKKKLLKERPLK
jgi:hypothetical protein